MQTTDKNSNMLWKYSDLAAFLQVSVNKLHHDVMCRKIPFVKLGKSVRFDKYQIAEYFKLKMNLVDTAGPSPVVSNENKTDPFFIPETAAWLKEQAGKFKFADISIRLVIHNGQLRHIERTVTEKIREK